MFRLISTTGAREFLAAGPVAPAGRLGAPAERPPVFSDAGDTVVHLSAEARDLLRDGDGFRSTGFVPNTEGDFTVPVWSGVGPEGPEPASPFDEAQSATPEASDDPGATKPEGFTTGQKALSPEQERQVEQLRARDTEVRTHEAAHASAAGALGGRPSLEYTTGPDGKRYAVAGEVSIDTSSGRTPEETIAKARTIRAAATAPADPSAQDMAVASDAAQMEADARAAIQERGQIEGRGRTENVEKNGESGAPEPGDNQNEDAAAGKTVVDAAASEQSDPDMLLLQLFSEAASARGGMGHAHLASDCGGCRRAASAYV